MAEKQDPNISSVSSTQEQDALSKQQLSPDSVQDNNATAQDELPVSNIVQLAEIVTRLQTSRSEDMVVTEVSIPNQSILPDYTQPKNVTPEDQAHNASLNEKSLPVLNSVTSFSEKLDNCEVVPVALTKVDNLSNEENDVRTQEKRDEEKEIISVISESGEVTMVQCSITEHSYSQSSADLRVVPDNSADKSDDHVESRVTEIMIDNSVVLDSVVDTSKDSNNEFQENITNKEKKTKKKKKKMNRTENEFTPIFTSISPNTAAKDSTVQSSTNEAIRTEQKIFKVYRCGKCSKSFYDTGSYLEHLPNHADQETFDCLICQKKLSSIFKLKRHMLLHDSKHKCDICGKMFIKEKNLTMHKNLHDKKMFNCSKCEKKFFRPGDLKNHMAFHQTSKQFKCEECGMTLSRYDSYLWHKKGHNPEEVMKCETCEEIITSLNCLRHHIKLHKKEQKENEMENNGETENEELSYICQYCNETYKDYKEFTKHIDSHGAPDAYECNKCQKKFATHASIYKHKLRCENTDKYPCSVCDKVFKYERTLEVHMNYHNGILFRCQEDNCTKEFKTKQGLFIHMKIHAGTAHTCKVCGKLSTSRTNHEEHIMIHTGEKPHVCPQCGKGFIQKRKLKEHMHTHSGKNRAREKIFQCSLCDHAYSSKKALVEHTRDHTGDMPYVCNICGMKFSRQTGYRNHMNRHEDKRSFKCKECGKGFNYNSNLKAHMVVHSGVKPFKCDVCSKSYTRAAELRHHHATIHQGKNLNKFFCKFCNKGFSHVTNLRHHVYTHTGEKPYKCRMCEAAFTTNQSLKFHKQKVHGIKDEDTTHKIGKYRDHENLEKGLQCDFSSEEEEEGYEEATEEEVAAATVRVQHLNEENVIYLNLSDLDDAESFIAIIEAPMEVQTSQN